MLKYVPIILCFYQLANSIPTMGSNKLISYKLPEGRQWKKSLGYFEDTYLNFTELATKYKYATEQHTITTEDGYLLTVFRILAKCPQPQFPVILGHGIIDSSDAWILTGPETGLGFILSNNCYDVWAVNFRGNVYSRKHVRLDPDKYQTYWDFSFEENGNYDLPSIIDYVLNVTRQAKVSYIGHSQGTTDFFVMGSLRPEYNEKIHLSIQVAAVAWLKNIRSPIPRIILREAKQIKSVFETVGISELFAKHQFIHMISELLCQIAPNGVCGAALSLTTGYVLGSITSKNLAIIIGHLLVGVSVKTLVHFAQLIVSGDFQRYDEGEVRNIKKYGSMKPTSYDVSLITSPVVLISAQNDWISTLDDIDILASNLPTLVDNYVVPDSNWSHNNHLWGVNASELVFNKILNYLQTSNIR